jgi:hypothetical protein
MVAQNEEDFEIEFKKDNFPKKPSPGVDPGNLRSTHA